MDTPGLPNYYAIAWTLTNFLILLAPIVLLAGLIWYIRQKQAFQQNLLEKMDRLLALLEKEPYQ